MFKHLIQNGMTDLHFGHDARTGMRAIVAIHSTVRGPAIGGCRFLPYANDDEALADAIRLAQGMSYKAALAELPHGGAKAVLIEPEHNYDRTALMEAFGRFVEQLGGRYITAMDSGTQVSDMDIIARQTRWVTCTSQVGAPSHWTAMGLMAGIRASVRHQFGDRPIRGLKVAIQGMGHVGYALARILHNEGAQLFISDIDPAKADAAARDFGVQIRKPENIYSTPVDIFSPCGLGGVINEQTLEQLQCKIIAGSANNQLASPELGEQLRQRQILYAPDYLINAGGLIYVALKYQAVDDLALLAKINGIEQSLQSLFQQADANALATSAMADRKARRILAEAGHPQPEPREA